MTSLDQLGIKHQTDKSSQHHDYLKVYEKYFDSFRTKDITLFEIGVGGYQFSNRGGQSLRMWCEYFKQGKIISIDLYDKSEIHVPVNGKVIQANQTDINLPALIDFKKVDFVIDDGSHINPLTIQSFEIIYPHLSSGALYIVEDTETSYWSAIATDGTDFKGGTHDNTVMNYFKRKCDEINLLPDSDIKTIHFYSGLIVIQKK